MQVRPDPYETLIHLTTGVQVAAASLSDEELIEGARAGYDAYIGALWRRFGPGLLHGIRHVAGDRAEEVVTDVFMTLPHTLTGYTERGAFSKWLFGVAFNIARTRRRSDSRRPEVEWSPAVTEPLREPSAQARIDEKHVLELVMHELSDTLREAFLLSIKGFGPREIARMLDISAEAAAVRVHRARERIEALFPGLRM
ncbi:MAG: RNA polymerase sigma factor [Gemmatimonadetes bacterium]|nr:RNA polymerase sigma factor [Gemmatimonadota bacterium]